jgi:predicted dehydrogenase
MEEHEMTKNTQIGLIGAGRFGRLILSCLRDLGDVELVAVCNRTLSKAEKVAEDYGIQKVFSDYHEMLDKVPMDACFVVTDEASHAAITLASLDHGCHVFVEKPLATTLADGIQMRDSAREKKLQLHVGYILRFAPDNAYLKAEIDRGAFGRIGSIRVKRNCSRQWFHDFGKRINLVYETGCHDIDLIVFLTGKKGKKVYATARHMLGYDNPDLIMAMIELEDNTPCFLETSWLAPDCAPANLAGPLELAGVIDSELEIVAEKQTARARLLDSSLQIWSDRLVRVPDLSLWPEVHGRVMGALQSEVAHFVECIRDEKESMVQSADQAVEVMRIADAVALSMKEGREIRLSTDSLFVSK